MKVYRLNDYEWWAGESFFRVARHYMRITGCSREEAFDQPHELGEGEMNAERVKDEDGELTGEEGKVITFAETLGLHAERGTGDGKPFFFAGREW